MGRRCGGCLCGTCSAAARPMLATVDPLPRGLVRLFCILQPVHANPLLSEQFRECQALEGHDRRDQHDEQKVKTGVPRELQNNEGGGQ
jgi:hypothetical protein